MSFGNAKDRLRKYKEYLDFRKNVPKKDISFLTRKERRSRVCETVEELEPFIDRILVLADKAAAKGDEIVCTLDVEEDFVDPKKSNKKEDQFFWHKRQLAADGVPRDEINRWEAVQKKMAKEWQGKSAKSKRNQRAEYELKRWEEGLVKSDCFSVQVAAVQDKGNEATFIANLRRVAANSFGDGVAAPALLRRLLAHKAIVWSGVGIKEDLKLVSDSLFRGAVGGFKCVELQAVYEAWKGPLVKDPKFYGMGLLGIFQRVFEDMGWTWPKSPMLTRCNWSGQWSDDMIEYGLMDVHGVVMIL